MDLQEKTKATLFDIVDIDYSELHTCPDAIKEIKRRDFDGLIIRNVFSADEVNTFKQDICRVKKDWIVITPEGLTIPGTYTIGFDESGNGQSRPDHFKACNDYTHGFSSVFGHAFKTRVEGTFQAISGNREVCTPVSPEGLSYPPDSIRVLFPYQGGIQIHCENYLYSLFPRASEDLKRQLDYIDGLSYWVLINQPDEGGELSMFDLEWDFVKDDLQSKVNFNALGKIDLVEKEKLKQMKIKVNEGDMFLFAAGQIWHCIENIKGIRNRVTLGGFIGFGRDDRKIYRWS